MLIFANLSAALRLMGVLSLLALLQKSKPPQLKLTPTPGVGVGVSVGSFHGVFGPSNWTSCFRGLTGSPAADANTVTGVVGVVVAGTVFFTGVSPTVARRLDFWLGVCGSDAVSPTHCSVGIAVVEIIVAVVVGTVIVSLCTAYGSSGSSASSLSESPLSFLPGNPSEHDVY